LVIFDAGLGLDEAQHFVQRLEDKGAAAGGVLHLPPPQWAAVGPRETRLPPYADDKGVGL